MSISELYRAIGAPGGVSGPTGTPEPNAIPPRLTTGAPSEFQKLLKDEQTKINLSHHAETRIRSRSIPWDEHIEKRISGGIDAAHAKGSREALIIADNVAVIANVKSRTIVTAMDRSQMKERIFTNIDSAVLV
jgi:flagellar operon protein